MLHNIYNHTDKNEIQIHSNYPKTYIKNSGQYGLENKNNSFTLGIEHNKNLYTDSIHHSKTHIIELITQAWKNDKFEIEKGKFATGYPETAQYDLCNQKLSVVFKFSKDQYSRKEDNQDIYKPDSVINKNITNNSCCPDIIIQNGFIDSVSLNSTTFVLNLLKNIDCCCNIQYSIDGTSWQQLSSDYIECDHSTYTYESSNLFSLRDIIP